MRGSCNNKLFKILRKQTLKDKGNRCYYDSLCLFMSDRCKRTLCLILLSLLSVMRQDGIRVSL